MPQVVTVDEERPLDLHLDVPPRTRVAMTGLPTGARFMEAERRLVFTPDAIQGPATHAVTVVLRNDNEVREHAMSLVIRDAVALPPIRVTDREVLTDVTILHLEQTTTAWLDVEKRSFEATLSIPHPASERLPVLVRMHGFGDAAFDIEPSFDAIVLRPEDPDTTYWWGYQAPNGTFVPYTLRRVLHLLGWVIEQFPQADPERVRVEGMSMGGFGALMFGAHHARHIAMVDARLSQPVPLLHRDHRIRSLRDVWGPTPAPRGPDPWKLGDFTWLLRHQPATREQLYYLRNRKDDSAIFFRSFGGPSPFTRRSTVTALAEFTAGHVVYWDEGSHTEPDPLLHEDWWESESDLLLDGTTFVARSLSFPAFTQASDDSDPGDGQRRPGVPLRQDGDYSGHVAVPYDSGWSGDRTGTINHGLRWDARRLVDTWERWSVPLRTKGGQPRTVAVTPRRVQAFHLKPGEAVDWQYGTQQGRVRADAAGAVTISDLPIDGQWRSLDLFRVDVATNDDGVALSDPSFGPPAPGDRSAASQCRPANEQTRDGHATPRPNRDPDLGRATPHCRTSHGSYDDMPHK
ncbi:MAG: hypothetical protein AAGA48_34715 [Myxococcota bacterium]